MAEAKKVTIFIFVESRYQVDRKRIRKSIIELLGEAAITNPVELSVAIVGDRKMRDLNNRFRGKDKTTNILSFPLSEGETGYLPTDILRLGDIVIAYPQVIREAAAYEELVDDRIDMLVRHGLMHLLGMHHEESNVPH